MCIGKATRLFDYIIDKKKTYVAELQLGQVTDTQDATGTVLEEKPVRAAQAELDGEQRGAAELVGDGRAGIDGVQHEAGVDHRRSGLAQAVDRLTRHGVLAVAEVEGRAVGSRLRGGLELGSARLALVDKALGLAEDFKLLAGGLFEGVGRAVVLEGSVLALAGLGRGGDERVAQRLAVELHLLADGVQQADAHLSAAEGGDLLGLAEA